MIVTGSVEVWTGQDEQIEPEGEIEDAPNVTIGISRTSKAIIDWIISFIFFIQYSYGLSDTLSDLILKFLKVLFKVLSTLSDGCTEIARGLPGTLYMIRKRYSHIQKCIVRYVVCRKCF